ncbi:hypothetical protein JW998_13065, partial [candidate division KSB1 bacterium]|nr:hypothetical protein [candidate division KSB1 bacterium]
MLIKTAKSILVVLLFSAPFLRAEDALVWYPGGAAANSAQAIQSALTANAKSAALTTTLSGYTLSNYNYLFICLSVYPNSYVLTSGSDVDAVIAHLSVGGNVYMEGGDTWAWDFPTSLHAWFNLYGEADGEADLSTLQGASCFANLSYNYSWSHQYIDRLVPLDGAFVLFTNDDPAYACGIGYSGVYRTIGISFEFGGLTDGDDTKAELMSDILDFFDNGCSSGKPAPLNVHAFSHYDNAVPLVWDAPPGQIATVQSQQLRPSLIATRDFADVKTRTAIGRTRSSSMQNAFMARTAAVGYQADSYTVYRSTAENSGYSILASNISRLYYRDETATNGITYYYYIKAVYNGQEGEASLKVSAQPSAQNSATSPWKFSVPSINGQIQTDEWINALPVTITAPGATSTATLYVFNNDDHLYMAIDDPGNTSLNTDDQLGLNFDENHDLNWPTTSLAEEGTLWLPWSGSSMNPVFRGLSGHWPSSVNWAYPMSAVGITCSASTASGHVQYEARIDLTSSAINTAAGGTMGAHIYSLDMPDSTFTAAWPTAVATAPWQDAWMLPVLYGTMTLSAKGGCPFISDDESITAIGSYDFNEFGDGRKVQMNFTALTGTGSVTVQQTNGCLSNPINDKYINCVWSVSKGAGISDFVADVSFYYNDADVSALDEAKLQVHWWNGSTWQYEGGTVDAGSNKVTCRTNHLGDFALFERDHVLLNVNVFLEGAYESGGVMRTTLQENSLIPLTSTHADGRVLSKVPADVCDWVKVELRSTPAGAAVSQRSFLLKKTGAVV